MSWLGGPLPGTGETIGLNPAPKFDPSYSDFYDGGGWTETIIGPDMSKEIYRGTIGDTKWNENISGGLDNIEEWLKLVEDKEKENQFVDSLASDGSGSMTGQMGGAGNSWWKGIPGTSVGMWGENQGNRTLGSSALYAAHAANQQANRMAGQQGGLDIHDVASIGANWATNKMSDMVIGAIPGVGPALVVANKLYDGGLPQLAKDATGALGKAGNSIARFAGDAIRGIRDWFCDERLKVDIAPLERTEVNNELAQMAFFVKGIRECS